MDAQKKRVLPELLLVAALFFAFGLSYDLTSNTLWFWLALGTLVFARKIATVLGVLAKRLSRARSKWPQ